MEKQTVMKWLNSAKKGDLGEIQSLYASNPDIINTRGEGTSLEGIGSTALHWSISKGFAKISTFLINGGADLNIQNGSGSTPLHTACTYGHESIARQLLLNGCSPFVQNEDGVDAEAAARQRQHPSAAELVASAKLAHSVRGVDVSKWKTKEMKALTKLVDCDLRDVLEVDDMRRKCKEILSSTPQLAWMTTVNDEKNGSSGQAPSHKAEVASKPNDELRDQNEKVTTAQAEKEHQVEENLGVASRGEEEAEMVKEGVEKLGEDIVNEVVENVEKLAVEKQATSEEQTSHPKVRVEAPMVEKMELKTIPKETLRTFFGAVKERRLDVVQSMIEKEPMLLVHNGEGSSYGFTGNTALHWAAAKGWVEGVEWLLQKGARVNALNKGESTPLHSAAAHNSTSVVGPLVRAGGDSSIADVCDDTPIDAANKREHKEVAAEIQLWTAARLVYLQPASMWRMQNVRSLLQACGKSTAALAEKKDFVDAATALQQEKGFFFALVEEAERAERPSSEKVEGQNGGEEDHAGLSGSEKQAQMEALKERALKAKEKGNAFFKEKQYEKAAKMFSMALRLDPANAILLSNRSAAYCGMGLFYDAIDDARKALEVDPSFVKAYGRLGAALARMGQMEQAVAAYEQGLSVDPSNAGLQQGLASLKSGA
eukprot:CAMPEP_0113897142 /NCGR_PEP_ID=MMETSP0780_2-20120614/18485_1 /TAXON_ID=652834 /ORGANISM="Palpitomonas bilix" /LENGTH=654 /DNA_ID=CAMNT_0000888513 /DNA_START=396 /DNA_END=2360 /DNA_ORIENTATION=+ /assembly_acc=CAM_ASM_000599